MSKIRVLVVDDSLVIRQVVTSILNSDPDIEVVAQAEDPYQARELIKKHDPDVLTLDVEMPKMDGITFLANLMRLHPMPVVMLSTLTTKGADVTLQALEIGAIDYIAKPTQEAALANSQNLKIEIIAKVKQAAQIDPKNHQLSQNIFSGKAEDIHFSGAKRKNHLIAIGASTGGNDAIKNILTKMPENSPAIVITQHIPKVFSARFAARLNKESLITVVEATHGMKIKHGHAYIAPGDIHLSVQEKNGELFCVLVDTPEVNRHKPAVDVLFNSLQPIAHNVQAVLLTGMGRDGAEGLLNLKRLGARTIIQDKASSLVWGMPGSAFEMNAHTEQLALLNIAQSLIKYAELDKAEMKQYLKEHQ